MTSDFRRKAPRKNFEGQVGALYQGYMTITRGSQLGEGGALIESDDLLEGMEKGDQCVVTLFLPNIGGVVATASCVYRAESGKIGLQFLDLGMAYKKKIREFVSRRKSVSEMT